MSIRIIRYLVCVPLIMLLFTTTGLCAEAQQPAEAQPPVKAQPAPAAKATPHAGKHSQGNKELAEHQNIQTKLEQFAKNTITSINTCILPSKKNKQVKRNADGTYTAWYKGIDEKSLITSFKKPESSKVVNYIGIMEYHEVDYSCTAKTEKEAMKGPFAETRREPMQELIKYMKGKWTY